MASQRNWSSLSADYKARLERSGITRSAYESGASLARARGHAHTPEHPRQAEKHSERFADYLTRRQELQARVVARKEQAFGSGGENQVETNPKTNSPPTLADLDWAANASDSELWDAITSGDERYAFLWYH